MYKSAIQQIPCKKFLQNYIFIPVPPLIRLLKKIFTKLNVLSCVWIPLRGHVFGCLIDFLSL